jgi:hypothetical protein
MCDLSANIVRNDARDRQGAEIFPWLECMHYLGIFLMHHAVVHAVYDDQSKVAKNLGQFHIID